MPSERCMNGEGGPRSSGGGATRVHLLCVAMLRHAMLCCGTLSAVRVLRPVQPNVSLSQPGSELCVAMCCYAAPCYAMLWCAISGAGLAPWMGYADRPWRPWSAI